MVFGSDDEFFKILGGSTHGALSPQLQASAQVVMAAGIVDEPEAARSAARRRPASIILADHLTVNVQHARFEEALASLPPDFTADLLAKIESAQAQPVPFIGLMNIRQVLIRELSAQPGCDGDGFDSLPGMLGPGESVEANVSLCEALVQAIGFLDELLEA